MLRLAPFAALLASAATVTALSGDAAASDGGCPTAGCTYRVTPKELLAKAEQLVLARDFATAQPLIDAMAKAPELDLQRRFLVGYMAVETGDVDTAIANFRAILNNDPSQTRVRLELARALLLQGKESAADYHFRLAQEDSDLPEDIARTIRGARGVLRSMRTWHFNFDVGFAPDTNINNATAAETIDVRFGQNTVPLQLDEKARKQAGIGQTGSVSGGLRFKLNYDTAFLIDADAQITKHQGKSYDDFSGQVAVGPEFKVGDHSTVSVQALAQQRWYGGKVATRQFGVKAAFQKVLDQGQRVGLQLDARRTDSGFDAAYDGWQLAGYATYERVIDRSLIASATLYLRQDLLQSKTYSSTDYGLELGVGGELPMGINAGVSAGIGRAGFKEPMHLFSDDPRKDVRLNARAYVGLRSLKLWGFSPSATYTYGRVDSNYDFYKSDRHRLRFNFARYF